MKTSKDPKKSRTDRITAHFEPLLVSSHPVDRRTRTKRRTGAGRPVGISPRIMQGGRILFLPESVTQLLRCHKESTTLLVSRHLRGLLLRSGSSGVGVFHDRVFGPCFVVRPYKSGPAGRGMYVSFKGIAKTVIGDSARIDKLIGKRLPHRKIKRGVVIELRPAQKERKGLRT